MREFKRIIRNPEICGGQPTIRGTRVLVLDILDWLEDERSFEEIIINFPMITKEDIQEIIAYAKGIIAGEVIIYGSGQDKIPS